MNQWTNEWMDECIEIEITVYNLVFFVSFCFWLYKFSIWLNANIKRRVGGCPKQLKFVQQRKNNKIKWSWEEKRKKIWTNYGSIAISSAWGPVNFFLLNGKFSCSLQLQLLLLSPFQYIEFLFLVSTTIYHRGFCWYMLRAGEGVSLMVWVIKSLCFCEYYRSSKRVLFYVFLFYCSSFIII